MDLTGQSLGRYHILEQLGQGGMATVYKAYDTRLERDVAVKIIRTGAFPPEQIERILMRFEREAKALARLSHPNIVGVIDYGEHEGAPYLVMEYLAGGNLKQMLGSPLPWQESVRLVLPVARALASAHKQGIVHRDVKPANIMITGGGEPMLTDFGIAKILENGEGMTLTATGVGIGTPEYMAPEQWVGEAGVQADVYSLGIVLYELVTGRKPYTADTPAAVLLKQSSEPLPRPCQFNKDLPTAVEQVLFKALAKKPEDRYPDMLSFALALDGLLSRVLPAEPAKVEPTRDDLPLQPQQPAAAVLATPVPKARPAPKKRKWFLLLGLILGPILLLLLACLLMWGIKICPPAGPWPLPPWCAGSKIAWPFNESIPLENGTPQAMPDLDPVEMVWARHILVADEDTAWDVWQQIDDGKDWDSVCAQYTTQPSQGSDETCGDLGWFERGVMVPEFEETAFNLPVGTISNPLQTVYGWHILQVLGHEQHVPKTP